MSLDSFGGIFGSGPLRRGNRTGPPILADYPDAPQYDLPTVVQLLGVRPMTLWSWQQQLGMLPADPAGEGAARRYSERDLVACLWLRDQLLKGISVAEAAESLVRAQPPHSDPPVQDGAGAGLEASAPPRTEGASSTPPHHVTGPAADRGTVAGGLESTVPRPSSPQLPPIPPAATPPAMSQPPLWNGPQPLGTYGPQRPVRPPLRPPVYSGPLRSANPSGPLRAPANSGPLRAPMSSGPLRSAVNTGPLRPPAYTVPLNPVMGAAPQSGPLRGGPSGILNASALFTPSGSRWPIPTAPSGRELRALVQPLIRAFASFDTYTANRLVDEAISTRNLEIACLGLLLPALSRVAELGAHHHMSNPEQHFALNFVRGKLFSVFDSTSERPDAPIVFVACAPREMDDIGALALATFWRRIGMRVVFLGQDADEHDLVRECFARRPQLVCVCVNSHQRVRALARIARGIMRMEGSAPVFTYSGAPFARNPELRRRVPGVYLGDDPATATWHALRLLGADVRSAAPPTMPGAPGAESAG